MTELKGAFVCAARIFELIDEQEETSDVGLLSLGEAQGNVKLDNVCFSYDTSRKLIENLCLDVPTGRLTELPSLKLNPSDIKGSVGAGDAFCAGSLSAIYHQYDDEKLLSFASAVAATSLFEANATDGIRPCREVLAFAEQYQR